MKQKQKHLILPVVVMWLALTAASVLFVYPSFTNALSEIEQATSIGGYEDKLHHYSEEELKAEKEKIIAYNKKIHQQQILTPFRYLGAVATDDEYESLLASGDGSGNIMCIVDIPSIDVYLPVAHGTSDQILSYEAGHMYGSSLPYGGESTHAIIAAHTGLTTSRLFSDVKEMKEEDEFFIHILDEIHRYKVCEINVVPQGEEEAPHLQIEEGRDLITLYTCSPNGVNDHRILVKGERAYPDPEFNGDGGENTSVKRNKRAIIKTILFGIIPIIVFIIGVIRIVKKINETTNAKSCNPGNT